ncbi:MAG: AMP-binding protein, partial [Rhodospirillales bacterium]|nr:AMP-binding protein [Rhodospirillales bacterium]
MAPEIILSEKRIQETRAAGHWPDRLITDHLDEAVAAHPEKPAIIEFKEATQETRTISYAELHAATGRFALALAAAGIGASDVVSFQMPNWWQFSALHFACVRIGAVTNPLMPIYRQRELAFMLDVADSKLLVVPDHFRGFDYPEMIAELRDGLPALEHLFVINGTGPDGFAAYFEDQAWEEESDAGALFAARRPDPNAPTELLYTSGTTGEPKGVIHTHNTLLSIMERHIELIGLGADDIILQSAPVAHQAGFLHGVLGSVMLGATMVMHDVWDPDRAAELIETHRATYTMGATPFLADLANCQGAENRDLSS